MKFNRIHLTAATVALAFAGTAVSWSGFDWEEWRQQTGAEKPAIESPQAGLTEWLPLLKNTPDATRDFPVVTLWKKKRDHILIDLYQMLGSPTQIVPDPVPTETLEEVITEDYVRQRLTIPAGEGNRIPAYLLIPRKAAARPMPAMIVLHQTQAAGKREAVGLEGDPEMAFADELAKRGYLCLVPDAPGFGERIPAGGQPYDDARAFYEQHPKWSYFGKMNWEIPRLIFYLEQRGDVDMNRIGAIGHSHGAYSAIMAAAVETRISLVVASCGLTTFRTDPKPERWSHLTPLMPNLGFYLDDISQTPIDWHEIIALIAPRPLFNWSTLDDTIFPNTAPLAEVYTQLESLYKLYGMEGKFRGELAPGEHRFPKEAREQAYAWIDQQFNIVRE